MYRVKCGMRPLVCKADRLQSFARCQSKSGDKLWGPRRPLIVQDYLQCNLITTHVNNSSDSNAIIPISPSHSLSYHPLSFHRTPCCCRLFSTTFDLPTPPIIYIHLFTMTNSLNHSPKSLNSAPTAILMQIQSTLGIGRKVQEWY